MERNSNQFGIPTEVITKVTDMSIEMILVSQLTIVRTGLFVGMSWLPIWEFWLKEAQMRVI